MRKKVYIVSLDFFLIFLTELNDVTYSQNEYSL